MPSDKTRIYVPIQYRARGKVSENLIEQVARPEVEEDALIEPFTFRHAIGVSTLRDDGTRLLVTDRNLSPLIPTDEVLVVSEGSFTANIEDFKHGRRIARWHAPKPVNVPAESLDFWKARCQEVRQSWSDQFYFKEEIRDGQGLGLRPAQVGALHAMLAHWKVTDGPATVVMPTGTGKTETMLALLVREKLDRLLVVVPTNALRHQISSKFKTLGVLKRLGVFGPNCLHPIVGTLTKRPKSSADAENIFLRCNVIVTTMAIVGGCSEEVQGKLAELCSHLFIDEAHHVPASSWNAFRKFFKGKPIVQFTATPFRSDGKHIDGKVVFNYPLRKAQAEGYFKPIKFRAINEFSQERSDLEIARIAVEQLNADLAMGLDHIVMARAADITRAEAVYQIYAQSAASHNPLIIHSKLGLEEQRSALRRLLSREVRIVVCVQMLGEGFDLPELKIAALHDAHKSLAITLQFTGRFTRTKNTIGDATVVANIADNGMEESLRDLYAENADWNSVLQFLSEGATRRQVRRSEFLSEFTDVPEEIPLQNIFPKMSTLVYRTRCNRWKPEKACDSVSDARLFAGPTVNPRHNVVLFITRETESVPWGDVREVQNVEWHLYLLHWNKDLNLLFVNSSNKSGRHEELARSVVGENAELIHGEQIFRTLHGMQYLILMNLGLNHVISRAMRFTMYMGSDITSALSEPDTQNKTKSNLFGKGYEAGDKATIGCSRKGRIWSYRIAYDMADWIDWCAHIGRKLIDESITTESVIKNVIRPIRISVRPALVPIAIEWPDEYLEREDHLIRISIGDDLIPFFDVGLEMVNYSREGAIRFCVFTPNYRAEYEVRFENDKVEYHSVGAVSADILLGRKRKALSEAFQDDWPIIRFENGGFLNYDELCVPPSHGIRTPYNRENIQVWDWSGVDIRRESQTHLKYADSIQFRVIERLRESGNYRVIFNDDDSNEIADVIALRVEEGRFIVDLYHCKFSGEASVGARVDDLYAVCGQAQRSVYWKSDIEHMFKRLRLREESWARRYAGLSRFEQGSLSDLAEIYRKVPSLAAEFNIFVVQPGLSKGSANNNQLELLAATELYLSATYAIKFGVIASG